MTTTKPRNLNEAERSLLEYLLAQWRIVGARELEAQVDSVRVVGGLPTLLDLQVSGNAAKVDVADGPIPVRAFVIGPNGEVEGEILVWVKDGYLSGIEYAWYTDEAPSGIPSTDRIRVE